MRKTSAAEKLSTSVINVFVVFLLSLPFLYFDRFSWRISMIVLFFLYNLFFLIFNKNICLGMIICKTKWDKNIGFFQGFLYIVLYTLSFSTLFIWIWFPFDIFIANIFLIQFPLVFLTGTTLHGYIAGNITSLKRI